MEPKTAKTSLPLVLAFILDVHPVQPVQFWFLRLVHAVRSVHVVRRVIEAIQNFYLKYCLVFGTTEMEFITCF